MSSDPQATAPEQPAPSTDITPDLDAARHFLDLLGGPGAMLTFQVFDDSVERREQRAAEAKAVGEKTTADYLRAVMRNASPSKPDGASRQRQPATRSRLSATAR